MEIRRDLSTVIPAMSQQKTYAAGCWSATKADEEVLPANKTRAECKRYEISRTDHTYQEIRKRTEVKDVIQVADDSVRWLGGHMARLPDNWWTSYYLDSTWPQKTFRSSKEQQFKADIHGTLKVFDSTKLKLWRTDDVIEGDIDNRINASHHFINLHWPNHNVWVVCTDFG